MVIFSRYEKRLQSMNKLGGYFIGIAEFFVSILLKSHTFILKNKKGAQPEPHAEKR